MSNSFTITGVILLKMNKSHKHDILCLGMDFSRLAFLSQKILGNAVTSQHGALLSDDIKALKINR